MDYATMKKLTLACVLALATGCGQNAVKNLPECSADHDCRPDGCSTATCNLGVCAGAGERADCRTCSVDADCVAAGCDQSICLGDNTCDDTACEAADGPESALVEVQVQPNGAAFVDGEYSVDPAFTAFIADDDTALDVPIGDCVDDTFTPFPDVTALSMGDVQLADGSTTLLDLPPDASDRYESSTVATLTLGLDLDLIVTGSPDAAASTVTGGVAVPALPQFSTLAFTGTDHLASATFTYSSIAADHLFLDFQYIDSTTGQPVSLRCALDPAGTSYTMDATHFAGLGSSGSVSARVVNVRKGALAATDQPRTLVAQTSLQRGGNYAKP